MKFLTTTIIHLALALRRRFRGPRIVHARQSHRRALQCRVCLAIRNWLIAHST